jgi:DNA-binding transcriptional ArsR family regulator
VPCSRTADCSGAPRAARNDLYPAKERGPEALKEAGLITERRAGTQRLYSVRPDGLADLQGFLADVLPERMIRLKQVAEEEERRRDGGGPAKN